MHTTTLTSVPLLEVFIFLQLADLLTTVIGIRFGAQELNPIVRQMMSLGTVEGLVLCKLLMISMAAVVLWYQRSRVVVIVNYLFAALVVWNLTQLLKLAQA
jgi:hypothetical protein